MSFSVADFRVQFPILTSQVNGQDLVYFDNAATSQKPERVIARMNHFYRHENANVHRGVHALSMAATEAYEGARQGIALYLNAASVREIIFTRGATDGINLVAASLGKTLKAGDEILVSAMEHHSNIVPWQMLREERGIVLKVIPFHEDGELDLDALANLLSHKTKLVAVNHMSNALGTINPIEKITNMAHAVGAYVLVDGAQSTPHKSIDVKALDCDFFVVAGHKAFGPTGIGVLYAKEDILQTLPPYQGGGDMILQVSFEKTQYNELPYRFEAGTPNIAGAIGLGEAFAMLAQTDLTGMFAHEMSLLKAWVDGLHQLDGVRLVGTAVNKGAVQSFVIDGVHPLDLATLMDQDGVALRAGHHCAQPALQRFGVSATLRASFAGYNTLEEVHKGLLSLESSLKLLR